MDKMKLSFDIALAGKYTSASQKIRVMSEDWVLHQVFCPNCGGGIHNYANNKPVADFYCKKCVEDFELKSKNGKIGKKIPTGAYSEMIKRINSSTKPNFFFMGYLKTLNVDSLFVVPKHFFIPEIIEIRRDRLRADGIHRRRRHHARLGVVFCRQHRRLRLDRVLRFVAAACRR